MRLQLGDGRNYYHDFFADFSGDRLIVHDKNLPAGQIAAETLNTSAEDMDALIKHGDKLAERFNRMMREDLPVTTDRIGAMMRIVDAMNKILAELPLYRYLEVDTRLHDRLLHYFDDVRHLTGYADKESPEFRAIFHHITFYVQAPPELKRFVMIIRRFEKERLARLGERNAHAYSKAARLFFGSNIYTSNEKPYQPEKMEGEFVPFFPMMAAYIFCDDPQHPGETMIAERRFFDSLFGFLACDFYTGLQHGHAPMRCANCGRYFLNEKGYANRKYCDGYDPNTPQYTCRQIGAEKAEKERAADLAPKALCRKAKNKFAQACRDGRITEQERDRILAKVDKLQKKALRGKMSDRELEEALSTKVMYKRLKIGPRK